MTGTREMAGISKGWDLSAKFSDETLKASKSAVFDPFFKKIFGATECHFRPFLNQEYVYPRCVLWGGGRGNVRSGTLGRGMFSSFTTLASGLGVSSRG